MWTVQLIMELTPREKKIAIRCATQYKRLLFRNGKIIGWVGVILFGLGIVPMVPSEWPKTLSLYIGILLITHSVFSDFITVIGKLYELHKEIESKEDTI